MAWYLVKHRDNFTFTLPSQDSTFLEDAPVTWIPSQSKMSPFLNTAHKFGVITSMTGTSNEMFISFP
jgi:hypothetical protein